jgi:outer membrane receptor protein involved in Fe transport
MFELQDALSWTRGAHLVKFVAGYQHTAIDMFQAIAPNAFYVFAGTFPTNNAVANLLLGAPVTFYQGLGDFGRDISVWGASAYGQDEWRMRKNVTLNVGLRYERINPITEAQNRLTGFIPGVQSIVGLAPRGLVFPGDPASLTASRRAQRVHARVGFAWDPTGEPCGRFDRATACSTTSSRTAPAPRRRCPSARFRGRSSTNSAAPA